MNCLVTAAEVATKREAVGQIAEIYIQEDALFCDSKRKKFNSIILTLKVTISCGKLQSCSSQ